jgi:periplasmic divalent cation tolerance protein
MTDTRIVLTTAGSEQEARRIANALVDQKLAACVSIVPKLESIFIWEGKTQESQELMLIIKTTAAAFKQVRDAIKDMHSYERPECLSIAIEDGDQDYLRWITDSVKADAEN